MLACCGVQLLFEPNSADLLTLLSFFESSSGTALFTFALAVEAGGDRLGRATRQRFALVATSIDLESLEVEGATALRLRESWTALRDEIAQLGCVSLRARLLPSRGWCHEGRGGVVR